MSKRIDAIPTWQPSPQAECLPIPDPAALRRRWWQHRPAPTGEDKPGLSITWTPPLPDYETKLRRWHPASTPPKGAPRWQWFASSGVSRSMPWSTARKRWRPQTAR
jgi:hypothetical protein